MLRYKKQREKDNSDETAVNQRQPLGTNCVIAAGEDHSQKIKKIKLLCRYEARIGKVILTERKRVESREKYACRNSNCNRRENSYSGNRTNKMVPLTQGVYFFFGTREVIEEEIDKGENTHHISNIKVGKNA